MEEAVIKLRGFGSASNTEEFMEDWENITEEHPWTPNMRVFNDAVMVKLVKWGGAIHIEDIQSHEGNPKGEGSKALQAICDLADKHHVTLDLTAQGDRGTPTEALVKWYTRFGFTITADDERGPDMERKPR